MLMGARRRAGVIAVASAVVTALAVSALAYADGPAGTAENTGAQCDASGNCGDGGGDGGSGGGEVDVREWGTYTSPGETGDDGSIETVVVTVPPVSWYDMSMTGEDDGYWYEMHCVGPRYEGEDFLEYAQQWREDNPAVFVETEEEPPVGDVPPETLMEAADSEQCAGYGAQDSNGCSLTFERSSAHLPGNVTPVTAETAWSIHWTYNGEPQGALDPQTTTQTFDIPVAEIQTTVTDD